MKIQIKGEAVSSLRFGEGRSAELIYFWVFRSSHSLYWFFLKGFWDSENGVATASGSSFLSHMAIYDLKKKRKN